MKIFSINKSVSKKYVFKYDLNKLNPNLKFYVCENGCCEGLNNRIVTNDPILGKLSLNIEFEDQIVIVASVIDWIINTPEQIIKFKQFLIGEIDTISFKDKSSKKTMTINQNDKPRLALILVLYRNKLKETGLLSTISEKNIENLLSVIDVNLYFKEHFDEIYIVGVDGKKYSFKVEELFSLLNISNEEFDDLCLKNQENDLFKIKIFALIKYIKNNQLLVKYYFPNNLLLRFNDLDNNFVDIEAFNRYNKNDGCIYNEFKMDEELEKEILSVINNEMSLLEKAIAIYIKMCLLFSYDYKYYASSEKNSIERDKHSTIDYLSTINLENKELICYEFTAIYGYLLDKIGINFKISNYDKLYEIYGKGHKYGNHKHAFINFRCGKFIIHADSSFGILHSDLSNAKLGNKLNGIYALNFNLDTKEEFNQIFNKIYNQIMNKQTNFKNDIPDESFKNKSIIDRIHLLIKIATSKTLPIVDFLAYVILIKKHLFTNEELANNIAIQFVGAEVRGKTPYVKILFYYNPVNFSSKELTKCFIYEPYKEIHELSFDKLNSMLDSEELSFIGNNMPLNKFIAKEINYKTL